MANPLAGEPAYLELANEIRPRIYSGELAPGEKLPSEKELGTRYGVSRVTVRGAFRVLQEEGLIRTHQGKGSFVRDREPKRQLLSTRYRINARLAAGVIAEGVPGFSQEPDAEHDDCTVDAWFHEVAPTAQVAALLELDEGAAVLQRQIVYRVNGMPERLTTSFMPADLVRGTPVADELNEPWPGGTIAQLASLGQWVTVVEESVMARRPTPDEAEVLRLPLGVPVMVIARRMLVGTEPDLRPVEVAPEIVVAADRIRLSYRMDIDQPGDGSGS